MPVGPLKGAVTNSCLADRNNSEDYFTFSRGRFLRDEAQELSKRYVKFNVEQLAHVVARATGSYCCVDMHKFTGGMHNKAFLLTMDNGAQAVGKVPNPVAGLPHFTTASEVATIDFVSNFKFFDLPMWSR